MKKFALELRMIRSWLIGTITCAQKFTPSHPFSRSSLNLVKLMNSSMFKITRIEWHRTNMITIENNMNTFFTSFVCCRRADEVDWDALIDGCLATN